MRAGKKKRLQLSMVLALTVFFLPALGIIHEGVFENKPDLESNGFSSVSTSGGWEYAWGDDNQSDNYYLSDFQGVSQGPPWKPTALPINPPGRNGSDQVWFRYTLWDGDWEQPTILITRPGVLLAFEAFVDGEMVYSFGKDYALGTGTFPGLTSHLISLKKHMQGKILTLKVFSDYAKIGVGGTVYLGEKADLISAIVKKDIIKFVLSLFMVFIGAMDFIAYRKGKKHLGIISMFGLLAVSQGLYTINLTTLKDLVFFAPMFWCTIFVTTMTLIPIGVVGFAWETFRPYKEHFLYKILIFQIAMALACQVVFALIAYRWLSMDIGTVVLNTEWLIMILMMAVLIGITLKDALYKKSLRAKIYLAGFLPIIACSLHDIFMGFGWVRSNVSYVPYSLILFVISLEIIQRVITTRTRNKLERYSKALEQKSKEKEALINDLHDGIGGLITNIKFLSEMGLHGASNVKATEALKTISSLSSDSLTEIGHFMQSLDREIDWETIEKNFKALGNKMLIPMGIGFNMQTRISSKTAPPESLLFLNLLRIYKEALTNIVKHAGAQAVDVVLYAAPDGVTLSVKDDGKGLPEDINKGKGLNSMKTRAQNLGGTIKIKSGNGTSVVFTLCPVQRISPG